MASRFRTLEQTRPLRRIYKRQCLSSFACSTPHAIVGRPRICYVSKTQIERLFTSCYWFRAPSRSTMASALPRGEIDEIVTSGVRAFLAVTSPYVRKKWF